MKAKKEKELKGSLFHMGDIFLLVMLGGGGR